MLSIMNNPCSPVIYIYMCVCVFVCRIPEAQPHPFFT